MGYFSNGTEGELYREQWCEQCVHDGAGKGGIGCPVWWLHLLWNSEAAGVEGDQIKREALEAFIPVQKYTGFNQECLMFHRSTQ